MHFCFETKVGIRKLEIWVRCDFWEVVLVIILNYSVNFCAGVSEFMLRITIAHSSKHTLAFSM
jgi:hypothetical protein